MAGYFKLAAACTQARKPNDGRASSSYSVMLLGGNICYWDTARDTLWVEGQEHSETRIKVYTPHEMNFIPSSASICSTIKKPAWSV